MLESVGNVKKGSEKTHCKDKEEKEEEKQMMPWHDQKCVCENEISGQ